MAYFRTDFLDGMREAAKVVCPYCGRGAPPEPNEKQVFVHRTFSSNGLASDHQCDAILIYSRIAEVEAEFKEGDDAA